VKHSYDLAIRRSGTVNSTGRVRIEFLNCPVPTSADGDVATMLTEAVDFLLSGTPLEVCACDALPANTARAK
jgi:hypothetical protein